MTKEEILNKRDLIIYLPKEEEDIVEGDKKYILEVMDEYAEQEAVGFFLWYAMKMMAFIEYIQDIRPRVESHEMEEKINEFEGKPIKELYQLWKKQKQKP
jgi:hypothetical protein